MTKRIKYTVAGLISLFIVLYLSIFIIGKFFVDPERIQSLIAENAKEHAGLDVSVSENMSLGLRWNLSPSITLNKININKSSWKYPVSIESVNVSLTLWKLVFKQIQIDRISIDTLTLADSDLSGSFSFTSDPLSFNGKFQSKYLALQDLSLEKGGSSDYYIPTDELPIDLLKKADISFSLEVDKLAAGTLQIRNAELEIYDKAEKLIVAFSPASEAEIVYDMEPQIPTLKIAIKNKSTTLEKALSQSWKDSPIKGGDIALSANLDSQGRSPAALVANLKGNILAKVSDGEYNNTVSLDAGALLFSVMTSIFPSDEKHKNTQFQCIIANFKVNNGIATAKKSIAVEADSLHVTGGGTVNFNNGNLDLTIQPLPTEKMQLEELSLAGLVKVGGNITNPKITANPLGILSKGAEVQTAIMTAGMSIIGKKLLKDKLPFEFAKPDAHPCQTALEY